MKDPTEPRAKIIAIMASLPEAQAVPTAGVHLSLEVRGKRFGWYMEDHHGDDRISINCKAPLGVMNALAAANPAHYHIPQYSGHRGWVGVWLDQDDLDWDGVADVIIEAYRMTAPKKLDKTNLTSSKEQKALSSSALGSPADSRSHPSGIEGRTGSCSETPGTG